VSGGGSNNIVLFGTRYQPRDTTQQVPSLGVHVLSMGGGIEVRLLQKQIKICEEFTWKMDFALGYGNKIDGHWKTRHGDGTVQ
jgi:hypothetical protein